MKSLSRRVRSTAGTRPSPRRLYHELSYPERGRPGKVLSYYHQQDTEPDAGPFQVEMMAAPWNPADALTVMGLYPSVGWTEREKDTLRSAYTQQIVAGSEGWGRVSKSNDPDFRVGDWVVPAKPGMGTLRSTIANCKEFVVLEASKGQLLHDTLGGDAAALFQLGSTAIGLVQGLQKDEVVIQNAGNSAVGILVSQFAANTVGAIPISVYRRGKRSPKQVQELIEYLSLVGKNYRVFAEEDIIANPDDFQRQLRDSGLEPSLAVNAVGGESAKALLQVLGNGGRLVTYGGMSGQPVCIDHAQSIFKGLTISGYWNGGWMAVHSNTQQRRERIHTVVEQALANNLILPPIKTFKLSEYKDAFDFQKQQSSETIRTKVVFDLSHY